MLEPSAVFLLSIDKENHLLDSLKLQKTLFIAECLSLFLHGVSLITQSFEMGKYGAFLPSLGCYYGKEGEIGRGPILDNEHFSEVVVLPTDDNIIAVLHCAYKVQALLKYSSTEMSQQQHKFQPIHNAAVGSKFSEDTLRQWLQNVNFYCMFIVQPLLILNPSNVVNILGSIEESLKKAEPEVFKDALETLASLAERMKDISPLPVALQKFVTFTQRILIPEPILLQVETPSVILSCDPDALQRLRNSSSCGNGFAAFLLAHFCRDFDPDWTNASCTLKPDSYANKSKYMDPLCFALLYYYGNNSKKAQQHLVEAINAKDPLSGVATYLLSLLTKKVQFPEDDNSNYAKLTRGHFQQSVNLLVQSDTAMGYFYAGQLMLRKEEECQKYFRKAAEKGRISSYELLITYYELQQRQDLVDQFSKELAKKGDVSGYLRLGDANFHREEYDRALDFYQQAGFHAVGRLRDFQNYGMTKETQSRAKAILNTAEKAWIAIKERINTRK